MDATCAPANIRYPQDISLLNETNSKLAKLAGVGKETYRIGAKILNSDNAYSKQKYFIRREICIKMHINILLQIYFSL